MLSTVFVWRDRIEKFQFFHCSCGSLHRQQRALKVTAPLTLLMHFIIVCTPRVRCFGGNSRLFQRSSLWQFEEKENDDVEIQFWSRSKLSPELPHESVFWLKTGECVFYLLIFLNLMSSQTRQAFNVSWLRLLKSLWGFLISSPCVSGMREVHYTFVLCLLFYDVRNNQTWTLTNSEFCKSVTLNLKKNSFLF